MQTYLLDMTPSVARRIVRLKAIKPDTVIAPEIEELAEQALVRLGDTPGMSIHQGTLAQDILDFDFRIIIAMTNSGVWKSHVGLWLDPLVWAMKKRGLTDIVLPSSTTCPVKTIREAAEERGLVVHTLKGNKWSLLEEDSPVPRHAVLISDAEKRSLSPLALEFPHTVLLADTMSANHAPISARRPTLIEVYNQRSSHPDIAEVATRAMAFLFNVSYAVVNRERVPEPRGERR